MKKVKKRASIFMMGLLTATQVLSPAMNNSIIRANEGNQLPTPKVYDDLTTREESTDEIVPLAKVAEVTNEMGATGGVLPTSLDGNNIERFDIEWRSQDNDNDESRHTGVYTSNSNQVLSYRINYGLSGQNDYDVGTVNIKVPKTIFKDRKDKPLGYTTFGVPKAPDNNAMFAYTETDDAYIITNTKKLKAASSGFIEATINGLTPSEIKDVTTGYISDKLKASLEVNLRSGVIGKDSNNLDATFDTSATIYGGYLRHESDISDKFPSYWDERLKPSNPEDYYYATFTSYASSLGNQYYNVGMKFDARGSDDAAGAITLGAKVGRKGTLLVTDKTSGVFDKEIEHGVYLPNGENFNSTIYVAYPKKNFNKDKPYKLTGNVEYTMTTLDDGKVTATRAVATLPFSPVEVEAPSGSFYVTKQGDGPDTMRERDKIEGIYGTALNKLKDNKEVEIKFNVNTRAFGGDFTLKAGGRADVLDDYGQRPYKLITDDYKTTFNLKDDELTSSDFDIKALDFGNKPTAEVYSSLDGNDTAHNGIVGKDFTGSGVKPSFGFKTVDDSKIPDTVVYGRVSNGDWVKYGTVSYRDGLRITAENGARVDDSKLVFPENVTDYKTEVETTLAHYEHDVKVIVDVKPSARMLKEIDEVYASSIKPIVYFGNNVKLNVLYGDNFSNNKDVNEFSARDQLHGFSHGIKTEKNLVGYKNDVSRSKIDLTYELSSTIQTNLVSKEAVDQAIKDGWLKEQKEGVFYDLLPKGVIPITSSIKPVRDGDSITSVKLHENYKGSGRILMEIHTKQKPSYKYDYNNAGSILSTKGYYDKPAIRFNARYPWVNYHDSGSLLSNISAYSSTNEVGNVKGLTTEDNPDSGKNTYTRLAFPDNKDKELMTGLPSGNLVYARNDTNLTVDTSSATSLMKQVDVNDEGLYGDGLDNSLAKNVFEGGRYKYQISLKNGDGTKAKDLVFYDNLEKFKPTKDHEDFGDTTWHGTLLGVDVDGMRAKGANPIVYYSTKDNLVLDDANNASDRDLNNVAIWTTEKPADLSKVKAIAIDTRFKEDGSEFTLDAGATMAATITMKAPIAPNDSWYDGKLEPGQKEAGLVGGAHAYNNIAMTGRTIDVKTSRIGANTLIRNDYVKVGLKPYKIKVNKTWNDDNNRDGKRTKAVTMELVGNGINTGRKVVLNEGNSWSSEFEKVPYLDNDGNVITYTMREEGAPDYTLKVKSIKDIDDFFVYDVENYHSPEKIKISGEKRWKDESVYTRPESIKVKLKANGREVQEITVKPVDGKWLYEFTNLNKYENGQEIQYTLEEGSYVDGYKSIVDGYNITNEYHPYADVYVKKEVEGMTDKARELNPDFTFVMNLKDGSGNFVLKEFDYETTLGRTGKIYHGKEFTLKKDEEMKIKGVPSEHTVSFKELKNPNGYKLVKTEGQENNIKAGQDTHTKFINKYETKGQAEIRAKKKLKGRELFNNEFKFNLSRDGKVERVVTNRGDGSVTFSGLEFTGDDVGHERVYEISEMDTKAGGVQYDGHKEIVRVTAEDNGDGTMRTNVVYDSDGANFNNVYEARGKVSLKAWKEIKGGKLEDGAFEFVVKDGEKVMARGRNDKNGTINFSEMEFTQDDVGKTFNLIASEVAGSDDKVTYDNTTINYTVEVRDNFDGTLGFNVSARDNFVADINNDRSTPMFVNKYKDGSLAIEKVAPNGSNEEFRFRVTLRGKDLPSGRGTVRREAIDNNNASVTGSILGGLRNMLVGLVKPNVAKASSEAQPSGSVVDSGHVDGVYWSLYENGYLQFSGYGDLRNIDSIKFDHEHDIKYIGFSGNVSLIYDYSGYGPSMFGDLPELLEFDGRNSNVNGVPSFKNFFAYSDKLREIEISNWDTSYVGDMSGMFQGLKSLEYLDVSNFNTSNVGDMSYMFDGLESLGSLDVSRFDTSHVRTMSGMFRGLKRVEQLNVSNFDTTHVGSMAFMFEGMESLRDLDVSHFNTSSVGYMENMFKGLKSISSLNVHNFDTINVVDMSSMFEGMESLRSIDLSSFDTSSAVKMNAMFKNVKLVENLDVSNFKTDNLQELREMFEGMSSVKYIDISSFDFSDNSSMVYRQVSSIDMFKNMSKLEKIKVNRLSRSLDSSVMGLGPADKVDGFTGRWIRDDKAHTVDYFKLIYRLNDEATGTWIREKEPAYTIDFDTNGTGESIIPLKVEKDHEAKLPTPGIRKPGSKFKGWSKTQGGSILTDFRNLTTPGQKITLYAVWDSVDNDINIQNGTFEISVFGNERVILDGLPAGVEYQVEELTKDGWVLVGEYNTSGTIKPKETSTARFVNTNTPVASAGIKARKLLDGKAAGGFEFELVQDGTVKGKVTSNGDGSVNFDRITYNNPGEFDYTIREVQGTDSAITYDTSTKRVHISVTRDGSKLVANVTYPDEAVFNNSSKTGSIKVTKRVIDNTDNERDFTFIMTLDGREEQFTLRNGQEKVFSGVKYGTTYKVQEVNIPTEYTLASLTNASGTISSSQEIDVVATNQYKTNGSFTVNAKKVLQNRPLKSGEFTFELVDENGQVVDTVNNAESGEVTFNAISVNATGTKTYKIREKAGSDENIKYDTHEETVRVVTTNANGRTETRVEYDTDGAVFTNKYEPKVVTVSENAVNVSITKKLEGSNTNRLFNLKVDIMKDGKALENAFEYNSNLDATVKTLNPGGKVEIRKDETITIKNVPQGAKVKVVEDSYAGYHVKEGNEITKDVTANDSSLVVTNVYEARGELPLKGRKTLIGGDINDYSFNFLVLRDGDIVSQGTNKGAEIEFKPLTFTNNDIGKTFEYDIIEDAGNDTSINYDGTVHKLRVTVEDNGDGTLRVTADNALDIAFNNSIKADLPLTGGVGTALILLGLSGSLGIAVVGRRRRQV